MLDVIGGGMRHTGMVILFAGLLLGRARADGDELAGVEKLPKGRTVAFAAELGTTAEILGMGFDKDLSSTDARRVYPSKSTSVKVNQYEAVYEEIENTLALDAHANFLFVKAGAKVSRTKRYLVIRISQIDRVVKLVPKGKPRAVAPLYASKIYYGWALYVVVEGESSVFTTDAALALREAGAKLSTAVSRHRLASRTYAIGLRPKQANDIVVATSPEDVQVNFAPSGDPQPIYVEYSLAQDVAVDSIPWTKNAFKPGRYSLSVDAEVSPTKANGKGWDIGSTPPDPLVTLFIDGKPAGSCSNKDTFLSTCLRDKIVDLSSESTFRIEVEDLDFNSNDPVGDTEPLKPMGSGGPGVPIRLKTRGQLKSAEITFVPVN